MTSSFIAINSSLIQGPSGQQVCVHPGRGHLITWFQSEAAKQYEHWDNEHTNRLARSGSLSTYNWTLRLTVCLCAKKKEKKIHQMTSERDWMEPADGRDWGAAYIVQKRGAEVVSRWRPVICLPAWEPVIILIMWLSELMLARGEASPAVSINEPSLDGALISHCTGAVLFTAATSLTLLIPKGFFFFSSSFTGEGGEVGGDAGSDVLSGTSLCGAAWRSKDLNSFVFGGFFLKICKIRSEIWEK